MKKNVKIMALIALCPFVFSCTGDNPTSVVSRPLKDVTIEVGAAKITLDETTGSCSWSKGNKLSVFNDDPGDPQNSKGGYLFTADSSGETVTFSGKIPAGIDDMTGWVAFYVHNGNNSFNGEQLTANILNKFSQSDGIYPRLAGIFSGNSVTMKQVGGLLKVELGTSNIKSMRFRGNNEEFLAGWPVMSFNQDGNPVIVGLAADKDYVQYGSVVFQNDDSSPLRPGKYYIPVPPTNFTNGFTLTFTRTDDPTLYAEVSFPAQKNVERAHIYSLGQVDANLTWFKGVQFSCIDYPTRGAKNPVWPFVETASKSESPTDVKIYTTKAEGAKFEILGQDFIQNTTTNAQGVKVGSQIGDYLKFPTYEGYALQKVVIVSARTTTEGDVPKQCEYCLKNNDGTQIGENWTCSTRGASHTWVIADPQETAYRFEIKNAGENLTIQRMYLYHISK